jgi:hypothetical protein
VQPVGDVVALPAGAGGRQQRPEFFLGDPRGEDLPGRVTVDQVVPEVRELLVRQPFPSAEQPTPRGPRRVVLAPPATVGVPGDAAPDVGRGLVGTDGAVSVADFVLACPALTFTGCAPTVPNQPTPSPPARPSVGPLERSLASN